MIALRLGTNCSGFMENDGPQSEEGSGSYTVVRIKGRDESTHASNKSFSTVTSPIQRPHTAPWKWKCNPKDPTSFPGQNRPSKYQKLVSDAAAAQTSFFHSQSPICLRVSCSPKGGSPMGLEKTNRPKRLSEFYSDRSIAHH